MAMNDDDLLSALKSKMKAAKDFGEAKRLNGPVESTDSSGANRTGDSNVQMAPMAGSGLGNDVIDSTLAKFELKMPAARTPRIITGGLAEGTPLTQKQKRNICTIAYTLDVHLHEVIEAPRIHQIWPHSPKDSTQEELDQAGPRPSETMITNWLGTQEFRDMMQFRGVEISGNVGQLLPEQIALISILTDTSSKATIGTRLKRAGIPWPKYHAWRRQKLFAEALQEATGGAFKDAIENTDVQLAQLAQNGDLNAIKYFNEMIGRGPNDRKAVDAMQFAKIILEVVQRHVNQDQARSIAAEIGIEAKKIGLS